MGKTIEELFKTKQLADGKTAAEKYEIRDAKEMMLRSSTGAMDLPFKLAQVARRNLSSRLRETRIEEEVTGLRIISKLSGPVIYGTDIFKLSTQKTEMVTAMKDSVNPNNSADNGLLGNLFEKGKAKGQELLNKIGIQLPTKLIPTRISLNSDFKAGKEPDTMATLAKIKRDGAGNLVGKLLAQNAKGTPKQIGNQVLGAGINVLKSTVKKKLFGAAKEGAQNLAKKSDSEVQYDSSAKYSNTINPYDEDYFSRNDLSSILVAQETKELGGGPAVNKRIDELVPKGKGIEKAKNPFSKLGDSLGNLKEKTENKLSQAKKEGQQSLGIGKKIGDTKEGATETTPNPTITYSGTVDETSDDIELRNDLSTYLDSLLTAREELAEGDRKGLSPLSRTNVSKNQYSIFKNKKIDKKGQTLKTRYGIESKDKLDFLNEKTQYAGETLKLKDGTILDDYDFITLKFRSKGTGQSVNFRATVTGISETVSPSWDSAKFIGNPYSYYTYSGIERSVSFNFKVYSTTPLQHVAAWQRLNFLTSLTYPQGYSGAYAIPPFVTFTLGNLYKNKNAFIESLSYTMDDNGGWEIGSIGVGEDSPVGINGSTALMKDYKLPIIVDVSITLKFVESVSTSSAGNFYGFDKLPKAQSGAGAATTNSQKLDDANNTEELSTTNDEEVNTKVKKLKPKQLKNPNSSELNSGKGVTNSGDNTTTTNSTNKKENESAIEKPKLPSYKVETYVQGDTIYGQIYADGKKIGEKGYYLGFTNSFTDENGKYTLTEGEPAVKASLKWQLSRMGYYSDEEGKFYEASSNVS